MWAGPGTRSPRPIRRAIEARDQHCTFATCTAKPAWCHTHHLIPTGRRATSEANGALLCGYHHRFIHAHGWTGRLIDGHVHWQPPSPLTTPTTTKTTGRATPTSKPSNAPYTTSPAAGTPAPTHHPTPDNPGLSGPQCAHLGWVT